MANSEVKKRPYETPTMEVIELPDTPQLLAQSGTPSPEEVEDMWGG